MSRRGRNAAMQISAPNRPDFIYTTLFLRYTSLYSFLGCLHPCWYSSLSSFSLQRAPRPWEQERQSGKIGLDRSNLTDLPFAFGDLNLLWWRTWERTQQCMKGTSSYNSCSFPKKGKPCPKKAVRLGCVLWSSNFSVSSVASALYGKFVCSFFCLTEHPETFSSRVSPKTIAKKIHGGF